MLRHPGSCHDVAGAQPGRTAEVPEATNIGIVPKTSFQPPLHFTITRLYHSDFIERHPFNVRFSTPSTLSTVFVDKSILLGEPSVLN